MTAQIKDEYKSELSPSVVAAIFELEKNYNRVHRIKPDTELWKIIKQTLIKYKEKN